MAKERDEIEFSDAEELIKQGTEINRLTILISLFIAFFLFLNIHTVYSIYSSWTDESIPLTICPRSFDLDAPVLMKSIEENDQRYIQDRWIRGFIRRFVLNSYPRTGADAEKFFRFALDHSEGPLKTKYQSYVNAIGEIKSSISAGNSVLFYPKSSNEMRIRAVSKTKWIVEIEGFLVKNLMSSQERSVTTLRYDIEARRPTRTNPDGLVVVATNLETIADYVSGREYQKSEPTP